MIPRGSVRRALCGALALSGLLLVSVPMSSSAVTPVVTTLNLSLPGPFNGCPILNPAATSTSNAILDLIRPSAFVTNTNNNLVGEGGAIASAELTSLKPETVVYTIAPGEHWSDGQLFLATDLVSWWHQAKVLASVQSDGYRAIKTLTVSNDGLTLTAVFATPYAEWNKLFRDVEEPGVPLGCSWRDYLTRPSLGPYEVASATNNRILLVSNPAWTLDPNRFSRINITDSYDIPATPNEYYVGYDLNVTQSSVQAASSHPTVLSHIGTSSNLMEMTFAPSRPLTKRLYIREGISLILNRQELVNNVFGAVTFSPSVAQSALYSQGQSAYPGGSGSGPSAQSTTTTVTSTQQSNNLLDCRVCALHLLEKAGYRHVGSQWQNAEGAPLALRVVVGPGALDHQVASEVVRQWRINGIASFVTSASSDQRAAYLASVDAADVAIFTRPTSTTASYTARSFAGPAYIDTYPSGIRSGAINRFFKASIQNFNPVTAQSTWLQIDQIVLNDFWVRPLFTAPSLVEWSNSVATVNGSVSVTGFVDQVTSWGIIQGGSSS